MTRYEYKVVPAPVKGEKSRGVKGAEGRFAFAIERLMNEMAAEGWEYQRAETLPSEERSGIASSQTVWRNLLVFRRVQETMAETAPDTPDADLEGRRLASAAELAGATTAPAAEDDTAQATTTDETTEHDALPEPPDDAQDDEQDPDDDPSDRPRHREGSDAN